jgi:predicted DNA-binding protein (MmcQ/YjbR family)
VTNDPERFFVPPYVGPKGWVGVYLDGKRVDWTLLSVLIEDSYCLIAPKRLAARLDAPRDPSTRL